MTTDDKGADSPAFSTIKPADVAKFNAAAEYTLQMLASRPGDDALTGVGITMGPLGFSISGSRDWPLVSLETRPIGLGGIHVGNAAAVMTSAGMLYAVAVHLLLLQEAERAAEEAAKAAEETLARVLDAQTTPAPGPDLQQGVVA